MNRGILGGLVIVAATALLGGCTIQVQQAHGNKSPTVGAEGEGEATMAGGEGEGQDLSPGDSNDGAEGEGDSTELGGSESAPYGQCGPGTKLVDGSCVLDYESLCPALRLCFDPTQPDGCVPGVDGGCPAAT